MSVSAPIGIHEESEPARVCGQFLARRQSRRMCLSWERCQAQDAAGQEWDRGESCDDRAGGHSGHETNAFAERGLEYGRRDAAGERAEGDTGGRERARHRYNASLLVTGDDALT